jgi:hypothetical protein
LTAFLGIENTCPKWLDLEVDYLIMTSPAGGLGLALPQGVRGGAPSNIIVSPKLKSLLEKNKIKPVAVFEGLDEEEVKELLRSETRKKSGIYGIFNLVTDNFYIGSAVSNRFYSRFYKHLLRGLGNKNIAIDLDKYGIKSFAFVILEYYPEEITKKNNPDLMALETYWIKTYSPTYNILLEAGNSLGYQHSEEIKQKMKEIYFNKRRERIGLLNKGRS